MGGPQGGPQSAGPHSGFPGNPQSPVGASPGIQRFGQDQGGFGQQQMPQQGGYGGPMGPQSAGGYGRGQQGAPSQQQWGGAQSAGGFGQQGNGFGGYQG